MLDICKACSELFQDPDSGGKSPDSGIGAGTVYRFPRYLKHMFSIEKERKKEWKINPTIPRLSDFV